MQIPVPSTDAATFFREKARIPFFASLVLSVRLYKITALGPLNHSLFTWLKLLKDIVKIVCPTSLVVVILCSGFFLPWLLEKTTRVQQNACWWFPWISSRANSQVAAKRLFVQSWMMVWAFCFFVFSFFQDQNRFMVKAHQANFEESVQFSVLCKKTRTCHKFVCPFPLFPETGKLTKQGEIQLSRHQVFASGNLQGS